MAEERGDHKPQIDRVQQGPLQPLETWRIMMNWLFTESKFEDIYLAVSRLNSQNEAAMSSGSDQTPDFHGFPSGTWNGWYSRFPAAIARRYEGIGVG